jgi:hypothetical protein
MKIDPSQVVRTEEVTAADGRRYRREIVRLTPEQRAEYRRMVAEEERDLPRRIEYRVEAVFQEKEQDVLTAIDRYATKHGLSSRSAVVRLALAKLLRIELAIPHFGCEAGRPRKTKSKRSSKAS